MLAFSVGGRSKFVDLLFSGGEHWVISVFCEAESMLLPLFGKRTLLDVVASDGGFLEISLINLRCAYCFSSISVCILDPLILII